MWGCNDINLTGKILKSILESPKLCILYDKTYTYLHPGTRTTSVINLTLCSHSIFIDFHWGVHDDQCGSNHSPIFFKSKNLAPEETNPKWQIHKADWIKFDKLCSTLIDEGIFNKPEPMSAFINTLIKIAKQTIPMSSTWPHPKTNPWFTVECREAVKTRKKMLKLFKHNPTRNNLKKYQQAWAKACYTIKRAKKEIWRNYISKLNNKIPINKTWEIIGKISGGKLQTTITYLNAPNGGKNTDKKEIANQIEAESSQNLSSNHYPHRF